jgi:hypothetical protein
LNRNKFKDFYKINFYSLNEIFCKVSIDEQEFEIHKEDVILYDFNMNFSEFDKYYSWCLELKDGKYFISSKEDKMILHLYEMKFV